MFKKIIVLSILLFSFAYANQASELTLKGAKASNISHYKIAIMFYKDSCILGSGYGCYNLANSYLLGQGVIKNHISANTYFKKACKLKISQGCIKLGYIYSYAKGVKANRSQAMKYFNKGCKLGNIYACSDYMIMKKSK